MTTLTGKDALLAVKLDDTWYPALCAISCSFFFSHEEVLVSSRNSGKYVERMSRFMNWGFELKGLTKIDDSDGQKGFFYFAQASVRGQQIETRIKYTDQDNNTKYVSGIVLVMDGNLESTVGGFTNASLRLPGTGEPTIGDSGSGGVAIDEYWLYLDTTENAFEVSHNDLAGVTAISLVLREDGGYKEVTGTPVGRQFKYTDLGSSGKLTFDNTIPFNAGEIVYVRFYK